MLNESRLIDVLWTTKRIRNTAAIPSISVSSLATAPIFSLRFLPRSRKNRSPFSRRKYPRRDISANLLLTVEIENQEQYDRLVRTRKSDR